MRVSPPGGLRDTGDLSWSPKPGLNGLDGWVPFSGKWNGRMEPENRKVLGFERPPVRECGSGWREGGSLFDRAALHMAPTRSDGSPGVEPPRPRSAADRTGGRSGENSPVGRRPPRPDDVRAAPS